MIACVLIPRLALLTALGGRRELLTRPVALAPLPGGPQVVGEPSGAAEAFGIHVGMRLADALARCPALALVTPDPNRAEQAWEQIQAALEGIGAAIEPGGPGEAFFGIDGLEKLCGGSPQRVLARARDAVGRAARIGAGPTRLCAYAAALEDRPRPGRGRRARIIDPRKARAFLESLPVDLLRRRLPTEWERAVVPDSLERLGVRTLGELAALPDDAIADRFGEAGLRALRMARGSEGPLRPRRRGEEVVEQFELPEACFGSQLERALGLLVDRLLAHPAGRGRSVRRLRLGAQLAGGGGWRTEVALRRASSDRERLLLALEPKLRELPGPASSLSLRALDLGGPAHDQLALRHSPVERRRERLSEAVRQARAAAGREAILRLLDVEPESRVPERRVLLTPFPESPPR